jgi:hypothetical protein
VQKGDELGIDSVNLKTHDGMTHTLQNVRNILGRSINLISVKYSDSGGVLKVSKGSLICLVGDMNSTKLYVFRGSTLHGSISAAVTDDKPSKTNLWHTRLGHMSELGMAELMKRNLVEGCTLSSKKFCEHSILRSIKG